MAFHGIYLFRKMFAFPKFQINGQRIYNSKVEINPAIEQLFDLHMCLVQKSSRAP